MLKYYSGEDNKVIDALNKKIFTLQMTSVKVIVF